MRKRRFGRRLSAALLSLLLITGNFSGSSTTSFVYAENEVGSNDASGDSNAGNAGNAGNADKADSGDTGSDSSANKSKDSVCQDDGGSDSGEHGNSGSNGDTSGSGSSQDGGAGDAADSGNDNGGNGDSVTDGGSGENGGASGSESGDNKDKADADGGESGNTGSSDSANNGSNSDKSDSGSNSGEEGNGGNTAESKSEESAKDETSAENKADESNAGETKKDTTVNKESTAESAAAESEATENTETDSNGNGGAGNGGITGESEATTEESEAETETETVESTDIETLPDETLETEEEKKEMELLFHVVDEEGNDVDDKYNDVKVSFDREGVIRLDDSEKPPVKKVRRQTGSHLFGLIKTYTKNYTYKEATLNGDIIKAVKKTKSEDKETIYEYTIDGNNWTELDDNAEILLVYIAPDSEGVGHAEYIEEGRIKVTVDMNKELPEGVELRVSELKSDNDNYSAYMTALNDAAEESESSNKNKESEESESDSKKYTEENTMLYDIAFIGTDEDGNEYEYQPGDDVSVKVSFLGGQLAGELGATDASNVEVKHLPIKDEVKENAANEGQLVTADITGLSSSDIRVEDVSKAKVTLDKAAAESVQTASLDEDDDEDESDTEIGESGDEVTFGVSSFCIFAFNNAENKQNDGTYWEGTDTITVKSFKDTLGLAGHVAVYADELVQNYSHLEGSIAVNKYTDHENNHLNQEFTEANKVVRITLNKKVDKVASVERTFKMRFFKSENPSSATSDMATGNENSSTVQVIVPAESTSGSVVLDATNYPDIFNALKTETLYVYEIDDNGNIATTEYKDSEGNEKYKVSYTSEDDSTNKNEIVGEKNLFGNYIGEIARQGSLETTFNYFGDMGFHTYLGSDKTAENFTDNNLKILHSDGTESLVLTTYKNYVKSPNDYIHNLSSEDFQTRTGLNENLGLGEEDSKFGDESVRLAGAERGTTTGKTNFNVINLISKSGNLQSDLEGYAGFNSTVNGGGLAIKQLLKSCEKDDEYLLINIDATGYDEYGLTKLVIDGEGSDATYPRTASHIVYNIVKRDSAAEGQNKITFEPYEGDVKCTQTVSGIIFAPKATVYSGDGTRGSVVANKVYYTGSGEIHQKSFGSSERRYVDITITNSDPGDTPEPSQTTASFQVTKTLTGKDLVANQFSFELKDESGNVLQTKQNAANGMVEFDPITYSTPGTYRYEISEVQGNEEGYTYDGHIVNVTVDVIQKTDGTLTAAVNYSESTTFVNTYTKPEPEGTSAKFVAHKVLENKDLEANQFTFVLKDSNNTEIQRVYNNANGNVDFNSIDYTQTGVYNYTITELQGSDTAHYTYDSSVIAVEVTVTLDEATNKLKADVTYTGSRTFTNTYKKPEESTEESTKESGETESSTEDTEPTESSKEETKSTESSKEETKSTESTTESTKATETTSGGNKGGGGGGGGGRSDSKKSTTPGTVEGVSRDKDPAETTESGQVLGVERDRTVPEVESESEGQVKGVSRNAKTGDNSMMRLFGVGFVGAAVLLLAWLWVRLRRKEHR